MRGIQVVKVGTSTMISNGTVHYERIERLGYDIEQLRDEHSLDTLLVVSGAVEWGKHALGLDTVETREQRKACARAGAYTLFNRCREHLSKGIGAYHLDTDQYRWKPHLIYAQEVTEFQLNDAVQMRNLAHILEEELRHGATPVLNYNDGLSTLAKEISNDMLAAYIAIALRADSLIILTDVDGMLDFNGNTFAHISNIGETRKYCKSIGNGVGGMASKLDAAEIAGKFGIKTSIGNGSRGLGALVRKEYVFTSIEPSGFFT